jgi:hypothetical protein
VAVVYEGGEAAGFLPHERGPFGQGRAIGLGASDCQGAVLRQGLRPDCRELLRACAHSSFVFDNLQEGQGSLGRANQRAPSGAGDTSVKSAPA